MGAVLFKLFLVILLDASYPLLKPSSKASYNVNDPFADPVEISFWRDLFGINEFIFSSNFNLFPDWEERWTVGVQFPETHIQSQEIFSKFS